MIIVCNGMYRSGSTLQYNMVRCLVEKLGVGYGEGFFKIELLPGIKDKITFWKSDDKFHVIKMHDIFPYTNELINKGELKVCYIYRDIRDVAVSIKKKQGLNGNELFSEIEGAVSRYYQIKNIPAVLFQRYEDVISNLPRAVSELAAFLSLSPGKNVIKSTVDECSIEKAVMLTHNLKNNIGLSAASTREANDALSKHYDRTTLLHPNHISNHFGAPGIWETELNGHEKEAIMKQYHNWLYEAGYFDMTSGEFDKQENKDLTLCGSCKYIEALSSLSSKHILNEFDLLAGHPWSDTAISDRTTYYSCLHEVVKAERPRKILEIGTAFGMSAAVMLKACEAVELFISLDLGIYGEQLGAEENNIDFSRSKIHGWCRRNSIQEERVRFYRANTQPEGQGDNDSYGVEILRWNKIPELVKLLQSNEFDVIFVDGKHTGNGLLNDLNTFWPFLKPGGLMICDDLHDETYNYSWAGDTLRSFNAFIDTHSSFLNDYYIWNFPEVMPGGREGLRPFGLIRKNSAIVNSTGHQLVEAESLTDHRCENMTLIKSKEKTVNTYSGDSEFTPATAYWNQRFKLRSMRDRILSFANAVDNKTDLWPFQWTQLMAAALEFKPDLILELGRGKGNSTCAFTEVSNQLRKEGIDCNVVSLCISDDWENVTQWRVLQVVDEGWFRPLKALKGNILTFDYNALFKGVKKCLVFWDAHGFDVAECVLGEILPRIAGMPHLVIMHDLSDARYLSAENSLYGNNRLWRGNNWTGPRIRLGYIDSAVEQAVAIVDFTSRNNITIDSADHSFDMEIAQDAVKLKEMQEMLGNDLFSTGAHWFWFTLNDAPGTLTYPHFDAAINNNFYEINIFERVQILGVSLRNAVIAQPHLRDIIPRINRYLKTGQINLAVKMIEIELGHLKESIEILEKLRGLY